MRVLDLDLDALLLEVLHFPPANRRPALSSAPPLAAEDVVDFLENRCGLSPDAQLEGVLVDEHDEVLYAWLADIEAGRIGRTIDVVHIDGHADLAGAGWAYLLTELVHFPVEERRLHLRSEYRGGVTAANYLAYAAACGILSSLTYVYPPGGGSDELEYLFRKHTSKSGVLELPRYPAGTPSAVIQSPLQRPSEVEPPIPYRSVRMREFVNDAPFERAYISRSPEYVPAEAEEQLMEVLIDYVQL